MKHMYALLLFLGLTIAVKASNTDCILSQTINLDSTAIRNLNSSPVLTIPQPPAGKYAQLVRVETNFTEGSQSYLGSPILNFYYQGDSVPFYFSLSLQSGTQISVATPSLNDYRIQPDAAIYVTLTDSDRVIGNGKLTIIATYRYVNLNGTTECDTIHNNNTTGTICYDTAYLTSTQIRNIHTTPQLLLPAAPAGKYVKLWGCDIKMLYNGTPYTGNTNMLIYSLDTTRSIGTNNASLTATDTLIRGFAIGSNGAVLGGAIYATTDLGNPSSGTSDARLIITYSIIDPNQPQCFGGLPSGIIDITTLPDSITGTTNEQIMYSYQIPSGTFQSGDISELDASISKVSVNGDMDTRLYVSSANTLTGATLIATWTSSNISLTTDLERKRILWRNGGFQIFKPTESNYTDLNSTNVGRQFISYNTGAPMYWIISLQLQNGSDIGVLEGVIIKNNHK